MHISPVLELDSPREEQLQELLLGTAPAKITGKMDDWRALSEWSKQEYFQTTVSPTTSVPQVQQLIT
jgi:hypothetical protein